jgi:PAS domain S-box-containing protein
MRIGYNLHGMNTPVAHSDDLKSAMARLAGIVDIAEDAIVSINSAQQITMFNHGAEKIFGYTAAEIIGQPLDTLLPARFHHVHHRHIHHFAAQPDATRMMSERREIWGRRKNGDEFPAEASISKYVVGDDISFSVILRDVTERRRQAQALERQVQQRTAHLNALLQFSSDLLTTRSADDVLHQVLQHALARCPMLSAARSIWWKGRTNDWHCGLARASIRCHQLRFLPAMAGSGGRSRRAKLWLPGRAANGNGCWRPRPPARGATVKQPIARRQWAWRWCR